uniref:Hypothetical secreted peptide n=1 Tax=Glossina morsitans morsitans TaxID=37546 RepID=D3TSQ8_GLOMM
MLCLIAFFCCFLLLSAVREERERNLFKIVGRLFLFIYFFFFFCRYYLHFLFII